MTNNENVLVSGVVAAALTLLAARYVIKEERLGWRQANGQPRPFVHWIGYLVWILVFWAITAFLWYGCIAYPEGDCI